MTTRAELRGALRRRLEDAGAIPLWDDATLNEALAGAIHAHGARFPREAALAVPIAAGATRTVVAGEAVDPARIVRVLDATGAVVPPAAGTDEGEPGQGYGQAWRWWDGTQCWTQPTGAVAVDRPRRGDLPGRRLAEPTRGKGAPARCRGLAVSVGALM